MKRHHHGHFGFIPVGHLFVSSTFGHYLSEPLLVIQTFALVLDGIFVVSPKVDHNDKRVKGQEVEVCVAYSAVFRRR
jgi:hypothetical protein